MKDCLIIYYVITLIYLLNKIDSGNKKLQKSFDEIFGEGWEEKEQKDGTNLENGLGDHNDGIGLYKTKALQQSDQNENWDQINEEKPTDQNGNGLENGDQSESGHENGDDQCGNDQQKKEIMQKYYTIKEKIKQKGIKCSRKERYKIEKTIAKKLGTNRRHIYEWIKEFGIGSRIDQSKKNELIQKFNEMTNEYKRKRKHSTKEWQQNYAEISKKLGVCYGTIKRWKKAMGNKSKKIITDDQQKREIIRKFRAIKEKIKQKGQKYSIKEWNKIDKTIANKLGTNKSYIYKWVKELGMAVKSKQSDIKKVEIIKQFEAIVNEYKQKGKHSRKEWRENYDEICKKLGIHLATIRRWKKEFVIGPKAKKFKS